MLACLPICLGLLVICVKSVCLQRRNESTVQIISYSEDEANAWYDKPVVPR